VGEFWAGLAGVAVGGVLSLFGVFRTLRKQMERDRLDDERRLRDRRHDRLREAYREVIATAYHYSHHAAALAVAEQQDRTGGGHEYLTRTIAQNPPGAGNAHAALLLEGEDDRAILDKIGDLSVRYYAFSFALIKGDMDQDKELELLASMEKAVDELAALARTRLADLERPIG